MNNKGTDSDFESRNAELSLGLQLQLLRGRVGRHGDGGRPATHQDHVDGQCHGFSSFVLILLEFELRASSYMVYSGPL